MSPKDVLSEYGATVVQHLRQVVVENGPAAGTAADIVVEVARQGRVLHSAGAGHSLAGVMEMFYRAGGLPFVNPLWHPDVLPLNGAIRSTVGERKPGLGKQVAEDAGMRTGDALVVFSNSGINPYPVELAISARKAGLPVIAVTSRAASAMAPLRAGQRLTDLADVVLDTLVPPGDVTWPPGAPQVAPLSSLVNTLCWNLVMVAARDRNDELPTWRSANTTDDKEPNEQMIAQFRGIIPTI